MGGYHGRTLGASAITSSYRYRRRFGHFADRAHFVPFPYCFRCPYGKKPEDCGLYCVDQFAKNFDTEYNSFWDSKAGESEFAAFYAEPIQATGGYVIPPREYFPALKRSSMNETSCSLMTKFRWAFIGQGSSGPWKILMSSRTSSFSVKR